MLIDWFTVGAQIVNFLILVWLLKKFLYDRILRAVDQRESGIAARLAEAAAREKDAGDLREAYEAKLRGFEQERDGLMAEARLESERRQNEMLEQARERIRSLEAEWKEGMERDREAFLISLRRQAALEILSVARRALADLAGADVQQCAVLVFLEKIRVLRDDAKRNFATGDLRIRSAFDLPDTERNAIRQALEEGLERPVTLYFEEAPEIGLGLELRGNGWRIGWSSESYLEAMEEDLRKALDETATEAEHATV